MLNSIISKWNGKAELNGKDAKEVDLNKVSGPIQLILFPTSNARQLKIEEVVAEPISNKVRDVSGTYKITVKPYMTRPSTPEFDFMEKWNNDIPMPLRTMIGDKIKETNGMVYMELHGDITQTTTDVCLCCGKPITNPVSKYFGMGPVCGGHNYTNPFDSEAELKQAVAEYRKKLQNIKWAGWIVKSAIIEEEVL